MKRVSFVSLILIFLSLSIFANPPAGNDQSLLDQGILLKNEGRFVEAFDTLSSMRVQFPDSTLLPAAEYQMGLTSLYDNRPVEAALQFQQVISKFPDTDSAKSALNMNAILYRLYIAPTTNKRVFLTDPAYSAMIVDLDEPAGMGIDSKGQVFLADRGKKVLYTFDPTGKMINSTTILSPYNITVTSNNDVMIGNDSTVFITTRESISFPRVNPETQARMGHLEEVRSVAINDKGHYFVVSGKIPGVAVYDAARNPLGKPSIGQQEEYAKVLINSRNYIHLLSRKGDSLSVHDQAGRTLFALTKTARELTVGKIDDFALDQANHIYLLTNNPRGVAIYSPTGKLLRYIASEKNTALFFDDSKLIAVSPSGSIYVLDKGVKRIVKLG